MALYQPWAPTHLLASARLNAQTPIGSYELFVPATAFWPWWAGPCLAPTVLHSGTADVGVLPFDPTTPTHAAALLALPKAVKSDGAVTAQIYFTNVSGGGGDTIWPIWMGAAGHGQYVGNWVLTHYIGATVGAANVLARSGQQVNGAVAGLAPHKLTQIVIARYGQDGRDTYPHLAYLIGVKLWFTTTEVNDA